MTRLQSGRETPLSDLVLRAELLDVLASVRGLQNRDRISFRIVRDGKAMSIVGLNHGGADQLATLISDSALLYEQLEDATAEGHSIEVSVPLRRGVPLRAQLTIAM